MSRKPLTLCLHVSSDPEVEAALGKLTRSELADIAAQSVATLAGHCDDPITVEQLNDAVTPVLLLRRSVLRNGRK